jgi:hypothetical protein
MGKATTYNNSVQYGDKNSLFKNKFNELKNKYPSKIFKSIIFTNHLEKYNYL